jgi:hypothetical protein
MVRKKKMEWWQMLMPFDGESNQDYVDRMCDQDDYHFVMKKITNMELMVVAKAYEIAKFRYQFKPGEYVVCAIRDLVFCCYGSDFDAD